LRQKGSVGNRERPTQGAKTGNMQDPRKLAFTWTNNNRSGVCGRESREGACARGGRKERGKKKKIERDQGRVNQIIARSIRKGGPGGSQGTEIQGPGPVLDHREKGGDTAGDQVRLESGKKKKKVTSKKTPQIEGKETKLGWRH